MPSLFEPLALGIQVTERRDNKVALFDTRTSNWWIVQADQLDRATSSPTKAEAFAEKLRSGLDPRTSDNSYVANQKFYVVYKLTDKCNFGCTYCYDKNFARQKNVEKRNSTIRKYLLQIQEHVPNAEVNILFHGGEPLLEFEEIKSLIAFGCKLSIKISYSIQSNASLLDQAKFDFFKENSVGLSFSVDGASARSNRLRINRYDQNCYALLKQKISLINGLSQDKVGLLLTIGEHNADEVAESVFNMQNDGFRSASFSLMHSVSDHAIPATPEKIVDLYLRLLRDIVDKKIDTMALWSVIEFITKLTFGKTSSVCGSSPCGAGRTLISVMPSGEVSPCDSLFSEQYIFSDLETYGESRLTSHAMLNLSKRSVDTLPGCSDCDVRRFCNGTCPGNSNLATGQISIPHAGECHVHYAIIRELVWLLASPTAGGRLVEYARRHVDQRNLSA